MNHTLEVLSELLQIEHVNYFYLFVLCVLVSYFIINPFVYFYVYKLKKNKLDKFKIQKENPTTEDIFRDIKWSTITIFIWTFSAYVLFILINKGYSNVYFNISEHGIFYFIFTITLFTILWDAYFYWSHRFMHSHPMIYKYAHSTHHATRNPTSFSIFAFNPFEAIILGFYFAVVCFSIPVHIYAVIIVFLINVFANILGHLGYEFLDFNMSKKIDKVFINSIHHNMHHKYRYMNYGIYFPFWDTIMNTFHHKYKEERQSFYKEKYGKS